VNSGHSERLRTPLIRKNGKHGATKWDEALDRVALHATFGAKHFPAVSSPQLAAATRVPAEQTTAFAAAPEM